MLLESRGNELLPVQVRRRHEHHAEDTQYLRVYIRHLRQKIEAKPDDPRIIVTELGIGYRIAEQA